MKLFSKLDEMHQPSSMTRARTVASAAPFTPIAGAPQRPKIKMEFRMMFRMTAPELIQAEREACSLTRMIAR